MNTRDRAEQAYAEAARAHAAGDFARATAAYNATLQAWPRHWGARAGLDSILEMARTEQPNAALIGMLVAAYADSASDWDAIGMAAAHQLRIGWQDDPAALARNALLLAFLRKSINRDPGLEPHLVALRDSLTANLLAGPVAAPIVGLAAALAEQAWANEHIWPTDLALTPMLDGLEAAPRASDTPGALLAYALHRPLAGLPGAEAIPPARWPEPLRVLAQRSVADATQERQLAATIPVVSAIEDGVSARVAAMYEANPYPRWTHLPRRPPVDIRAAIARAYPHAAPMPAVKGPLAVLMPGGGTGKHPLSVALNYQKVAVTVLDLSAASLAYAKRMAARFDVRNIGFNRGDILSLPDWGRQFDHAECVGVLHHMADPAAGLRAISAVLRPGALLRIGLYGEAARAAVVEARRLVAAQGIPPSPDGLRQFRSLVMQGEGAFVNLTDLLGSEDFYSTSLLRDLVFHEHEHRFTIPRLRAFLDGSGLTFLGFEFAAGMAQRSMAGGSPALIAYRSRHPDDRTAADLARWEDLEAERPNLFAGYAFWCQKA